MAEFRADPQPSASMFCPSDIMELTFNEGDEAVRKLGTPCEAGLMEIIEKDLEDANASVRAAANRLSSIECNLKILKQYFDDDKRRRSFEQPSNGLSPAANWFIETTEGPLGSRGLREFFMEKAFGKPNPSVLPIVRSYTNQIPDLIGQLQRLKDELNKDHERQMKHRSLDVNLIRRIDRLVKNIEREFAQEGKDGRRQSSMFAFTQSTQRVSDALYVSDEFNK